MTRACRGPADDAENGNANAARRLKTRPLNCLLPPYFTPAPLPLTPLSTPLNALLPQLHPYYPGVAGWPGVFT